MAEVVAVKVEAELGATPPKPQISETKGSNETPKNSSLCTTDKPSEEREGMSGWVVGVTESAGSEKHDLVECTPCRFFWKRKAGGEPVGCKFGEDCPHCHLCPATAARARVRANQRKRKRKPAAACSSSGSEEAGSESSSEPEDETATATPGKQRNPQVIERELVINANNEKYVKLTDEELIKLLPKDEAGNPTSIGAMLHESQTCGACTFLHFSKKKACNMGIRCKFCHASHPKRDRRTNRIGGRSSKDKKRKQAGETGEDAQEGGREAKRPRLQPPISARTSSELRWDEQLEALLDWKGDSRPSWLQEVNIGDQHHSGGSPAASSHPGGYPPASSHYQPAGRHSGGYPPAGGHPGDYLPAGGHAYY